MNNMESECGGATLHKVRIDFINVMNLNRAQIEDFLRLTVADNGGSYRWEHGVGCVAEISESLIHRLMNNGMYRHKVRLTLL